MKGSALFRAPYTILFIAYVLACLLFPAVEILNMKKWLFLAIIAVFVLEFLFVGRVRLSAAILWKTMIVIMISFLSMIFFLFIGAQGDVNALVNSIFLLTGIFALLIGVIYSGKTTNALGILEAGALILGLVVVGLAVVGSVNPVLGLMVNEAFLSLNSGYLGSRQFGGIQLTMIHFRTSPVLIIAFILSFRRFVDQRGSKRIAELIRLSILVAALVLSASRGIILFSLIGILILAFIKSVDRRYLRYLIFLTGVLALTASFVLRETEVFSGEETSNSIKLRHIESFDSLTDREPSVLLWGKGLGSTYYTEGFGQETFQTEVTFFDMVRYWGLPITVLILLIIVVPGRPRVRLEIVIAFGCYFLNAMANPLIFNSTGMLVIVVYWLSQRPGTHRIAETRKDVAHA